MREEQCRKTGIHQCKWSWSTSPKIDLASFLPFQRVSWEDLKLSYPNGVVRIQVSLCSMKFLNQCTYHSFSIGIIFFVTFGQDRSHAIISLSLYIYYHIFHCGLCSKAVNITDNFTKQGNYSIKSMVYNQQQVGLIC